MGKPLGRPTTCTPEATEKLIYALKKGCPLVYALPYAGIDDSSYHSWMEKGEKGIQPYKDFSDSIKACHPDFIMKQLDVIELAAKKEWTAAAWLAERRAASYFSKNATRIKIKQSQEGASTEQKLLDMTNQILEQVSKGEMTLEEGKLAAAMIEEQRKVVETINATERVAAIEAKLKNLMSE